MKSEKPIGDEVRMYLFSSLGSVVISLRCWLGRSCGWAGAGAFCARISVWPHRTLPIFDFSVAVGRFRPTSESPHVWQFQICEKQEVGADLHQASRILGLAQLELCQGW